jgi:PII-like signaling protein
LQGNRGRFRADIDTQLRPLVAVFTEYQVDISGLMNGGPRRNADRGSKGYPKAFDLDAEIQVRPVLKLLSKYHIDIPGLVKVYPEVLGKSAEEKLEPVLAYFEGLGMREQQLSAFILKHPQLLGKDLQQGIIAKIDVINRNGFDGIDESGQPRVLALLTRLPQILDTSTERIERSLKLIQEITVKTPVEVADVEVSYLRSTEILRIIWEHLSFRGRSIQSVASIKTIYDRMDKSQRRENGRTLKKWFNANSADETTLTQFRSELTQTLDGIYFSDSVSSADAAMPDLPRLVPHVQPVVLSRRPAEGQKAKETFTFTSPVSIAVGDTLFRLVEDKKENVLVLQQVDSWDNVMEDQSWLLKKDGVDDDDDPHTFIIGRLSGDIRIEDPKISRDGSLVLRINYVQRTFEAENIGSNPVYLRRILSQEAQGGYRALKDGKKVTLGKESLSSQRRISIPMERDTRVSLDLGIKYQLSIRADPDRAGMLLVESESEEHPVHFHLDKYNPVQEYILGRGNTAKVQIPLAYISREHVRLTVDYVESIVTVEDLNSSNGTSVSAVFGLSTEVKSSSSDEAMTLQETSDDAAMDTVGGIDLNPANLDLRRQGQGMDPAMMNQWQRLETRPVTGFTPVIFQIVPVTSIPLLLGIPAEPQDDEPYAGSFHKPYAFLREPF